MFFGEPICVRQLVALVSSPLLVSGSGLFVYRTELCNVEGRIFNYNAASWDHGWDQLFVARAAYIVAASGEIDDAPVASLKGIGIVFRGAGSSEWRHRN